MGVPLSENYAYDHRHTPDDRRSGREHHPRAGLHKAGISDLLYDDKAEWDRQHSWFNELAKANFTVGTWTQPGRTFDDAYDSAVEAYEQFLADTHPAPVALVGHSRGGLLIRKLLKEFGSRDRVKWVVTLHSPHSGSEWARAPGEIAAEAVDVLDYYAPAELTGPLKEELKRIVVELFRPLTRAIMADQRRELAPDSPLIRSLKDGESALPDVRYYTFGGVNPNYVRLYLWYYDAMSSVPQFRRRGWSIQTYFVWTTKAAEMHSVSPLMDKFRDFIPEVIPGRGDGLVTNASAQLPFAEHVTTTLNHAEPLWDPNLQQIVMGLLRERRLPTGDEWQGPVSPGGRRLPLPIGGPR